MKFNSFRVVGVVSLIFLLLLVVSISIFVYNILKISSNGSIHTRESIEDAVIEKMNDTYGESFKSSSYYSSGAWGSETYCFYFYPTDSTSPMRYKEVITCAYPSSYDSFKTNYLEVKYEDQLSDYYEQKIKKYSFSSSKQIHSSLNEHNFFPVSDDTFENYLKMRWFEDKILLKVSEFHEKEQLIDLDNEIRKDMPKYSNSYYVVSDECFNSNDSDCEYIYKLDDKNHHNVVRKEQIVAKKYEEETKKYLLESLNVAFPSVKLWSFDTGKDESYDLKPDSSFEEYIRSSNTVISASFRAERSEYNLDALEKVVNQFINDGLEFSLYFKFVDANDTKNNMCMKVYKNLDEEVEYSLNLSCVR